MAIMDMYVFIAEKEALNLFSAFESYIENV